jgi:hypothetical protein
MKYRKKDLKNTTLKKEILINAGVAVLRAASTAAACELILGDELLDSLLRIKPDMSLNAIRLTKASTAIAGGMIGGTYGYYEACNNITDYKEAVRKYGMK